MAIYSRALKHIDMNRVKELREEKGVNKKNAEEVRKKLIDELNSISSPEFSNWRFDLGESMTTSDMTVATTIPGLGDIDLVPTTTNIVGDNFTTNLNWSTSNGSAISADDPDRIIPGATSTVWRRADMKIPIPADQNISTVKITVSKGGGTLNWTDRDPAQNFDADLYLSVSGGTYQSVSNAQSGVYTFDVDPNGSPYAPGFVFVNFGQFANINQTGQSTVQISFQRRNPVTVFVPLDSPEASSFISAELAKQGSPEERLKKLKEMINASDEYLLKMFGDAFPGTGAVPPGESTIGGVEITQYAPGGPNPYGTPGADDPYQDDDIPDDLEDDSDFPDLDFELAQQNNTVIAGYGLRPDGTQGLNKPGDVVPDHFGNPMKLVPAPDKGPGFNRWVPVKKAGGGGIQVAHYEPEGEVLSEKKKLKKPSQFFDKKDIKPVFPENPPPPQINGLHPDLVTGEKAAQRYNRLDPISARAMPRTGIKALDAKVKAAAKKPK